jgi:cell division protease FtsH
MQVHAKNKPIDRSNDDAVLRTISELAIGFSGAELANLLNEGAILAVRRLLRCVALLFLQGREQDGIGPVAVRGCCAAVRSEA